MVVLDKVERFHQALEYLGTRGAFPAHDQRHLEEVCVKTQTTGLIGGPHEAAKVGQRYTSISTSLDFHQRIIIQVSLSDLNYIFLSF